MSHPQQSFRAYVIAVVLACSWTARADVPDGAVERIDAIANEAVQQKRTAGCSIAVVKDGETILAKGYGMADLENDVPATAETVYRIGSITKQFTATAIMQLVEQRKLSLDDELTKFLPDFSTQDHQVTVHHLLNHTSGIKSYTSLLKFLVRMRDDLTHSQMLTLIEEQPFDFAPGDDWKYNNSGYYLLGRVVEEASGEDYADYVQEHIFRPLGMNATRYGGYRPIIRHRARGYNQDDDEFSNAAPMSMKLPFAAGALVSNVLDLAKWHLALESGELLSQESYQRMYTPTKLNDGATRPYGYGWALGEREGHKLIHHGGGINGFSTEIARYPDDRLAVIVLTNTMGSNPVEIANRIARLMLGLESTEREEK